MTEILQWTKRLNPERVDTLYLKHFGARYSEYRQLWGKAGKDFLPEFPLNLDFELVDDCNLRCRYCFRDEKISKKLDLTINTGMRFPLGLFKKIMAEGKKFNLPAVNLGFSGECLLNPDLIEMIYLAHQERVLDIRLLTNGILMNEGMLDKLINSPLTLLSFSVDAGCKETYKKMKGQDFFDELRNIIRYTQERKVALGKDFPLIRATFYSSPENNSEEEMFLEEFQRLVDFIDFQDFHDLRSVKRKKIRMDCRAPFQRLAIFPNGDVSACCTFFSKKLIVGNVKYTTLKEIWDSQAVRKIRGGLINCKPVEMCESCLQTIS